MALNSFFYSYKANAADATGWHPVHLHMGGYFPTTADCAVAPGALTNERPIRIWGVSRLMAAAAAHSPADDLAPPSER